MIIERWEVLVAPKLNQQSEHSRVSASLRLLILPTKIKALVLKLFATLLKRFFRLGGAGKESEKSKG